MKKQRVYFSLVLGLLSMVSFGQRTADLGLRWNSSSKERFQLDYRIPVFEKSYYRISVSYGYSKLENFDKYLTANQDNVLVQKNVETSSRVQFKAGWQRQLRNSDFYFGADLNLAYSLTNSSAIFYQYFREDSPDYKPNYMVAPLTNSALLSEKMGLGIAPVLGWDYPVYERLIISASVSPVFYYDKQVGQQELNDVNNVFIPGNSSTFGYFTSFSTGLKVKF